MSIITIPFADCSGWLAFRMAGFRGLVVPERVVRRSGDCVLCEGTPGTNSLHGRTIGVDGSYHETLAECQAACRMANVGNPFGDGDGVTGRTIRQANASGVIR